MITMMSLNSYQQMGAYMASMTIRNLDDGLKSKLRLQAARHNRSMEEEARVILRTALSPSKVKASNLAESIRFRIEAIGGVELEIAPRTLARAAPDFL